MAAFWSTLILVRTFQRPDELRRLLRYNGNIEDAPLLVTAVVTTLGALLLFRAPLAAMAIALRDKTLEARPQRASAIPSNFFCPR
ncbi:hypothetical protein CGZ69_28010 [Streptomyces peucetius subsp. caesius ATCC 27952]|nr:hypothetical protein CGZ69_28010 [Streptomyces peucetius subsp. caesius ATCC 27952]